MEMRKDKRIQERNTVIIKSAENGLGPSGLVGSNAYTYDLSLSGTRLFTETHFAPGTVIRIVMELARTSQTIQVDGEVKWVRKRDDEELYEVGVEFLHHISQTILTLIRHLYSAGAEIHSSVTAVPTPSE
jgi:c-di-GMP-binding flagellar brake protein YcgR